MKILFIHQFFWPELAPTSVLLTDFARFLDAQGHEVTVICATTGYAGVEASARPNAKVVNVPTFKFGRDHSARLLSYASFLVFALAKALCIASPDVVITMTTPPLTSLIGACLKKFGGIKHYVWEMDMYPDVAVDLGVVAPNSLFARAVGCFADWGRSHADRIIALGGCMKDRLVARGVPADRIRIAGNWADGDPFKSDSKASKCAQLTILYAGNLGLGHDLETLSQTMLGLRSDRRFRFVFLGGGGKMKVLESFCGKNCLENVQFLSYVPRERFNDIMRTADIGLVTQNPDCVGSIVPSKFYSIAAAGLPILYIGAAHATPARLIDQFQCGWFVQAGQSKVLEALLGRLADDRAEVLRLGDAALAAFRELWDRPVALQHLAEMLDINARSTVISTKSDDIRTSTTGNSDDADSYITPR